MEYKNKELLHNLCYIFINIIMITAFVFVILLAPIWVKLLAIVYFGSKLKPYKDEEKPVQEISDDFDDKFGKRIDSRKLTYEIRKPSYISKIKQ